MSEPYYYVLNIYISFESKRMDELEIQNKEMKNRYFWI